ncbi:hypothetical protein [Runella sp.]|uniref:hypothetical protein n=1 Tax=Runella sp. TaxID=1960881 RepID=UPI00301AFED9
MKNLMRFINELKLENRYLLALIAILGLCLVCIALIVPEDWKFIKEALSKLGSAVLIGGVIHFLEHCFLRHSEDEQRKIDLKIVLEDLKNQILDEVQQIVDESGKNLIGNYTLTKYDIKIMTERLLHKYLPANKHFENAGLADILPRFDLDGFFSDVRKRRNTRIRFSVLHLPFTNRTENEIYRTIVEDGNSVEILIYDKYAKEALKKRVESLGKNDWWELKKAIEMDEKMLRSLRNRLPNQFKDKLKVKIYKGFISASIYGVGETYWCGLYLQDRSALEGTMLKIQGTSSTFFHDIDHHFECMWNASTTIDLNWFLKQHEN